MFQHVLTTQMWPCTLSIRDFHVELQSLGFSISSNRRSLKPSMNEISGEVFNGFHIDMQYTSYSRKNRVSMQKESKRYKQMSETQGFLRKVIAATSGFSSGNFGDWQNSNVWISNEFVGPWVPRFRSENHRKMIESGDVYKEKADCIGVIAGLW